MCAKTALKYKNLGKEVKNCKTDEWNAAAKECCFKGLLAKFQQNSGLAAFLKNTQDKTILECCYDRVWGIGCPLSDPNCINPNSYKSQGILGEMLEEIRDILNNPDSFSIVPSNETSLESDHVETVLQVETT